MVLLISPAFAIGTCNAGSELNTEPECEPEIIYSYRVEDERKWNLSGTCMASGAEGVKS